MPKIELTRPQLRVLLVVSMILSLACGSEDEGRIIITHNVVLNEESGTDPVFFITDPAETAPTPCPAIYNENTFPFVPDREQFYRNVITGVDGYEEEGGYGCYPHGDEFLCIEIMGDTRVFWSCPIPTPEPRS